MYTMMLLLPPPHAGRDNVSTRFSVCLLVSRITFKSFGWVFIKLEQQEGLSYGTEKS